MRLSPATSSAFPTTAFSNWATRSPKARPCSSPACLSSRPRCSAPSRWPTPLRTKQLRAGLTQLGEEGAIQVFRPVAGSVLLLGAVGQLQFEVVAHRLEHEYGVKARIMPSRFQVARWVTCDAADGGDKELQRFIDANQHRVAYDAVDAPTVLVEYAPELRAIEANWPKIRFHALREHAGLVFQKQLEG